MESCDNALNEADLTIKILDSSVKSCEDVVSKQDLFIALNKQRISELAASSEHSHIPHVAATSAAWLLLLLLL